MDVVRQTDGATALHVASIKGHVDVVKALLDAGVSKVAASVRAVGR